MIKEVEADDLIVQKVMKIGVFRGPKFGLVFNPFSGSSSMPTEALRDVNSRTHVSRFKIR